MTPGTLLRAMFDAAVRAALAEERLVAALPPPPKGRTIVVGAGKAAAAMARAVEDHWPGPLEGLVVTRYGHGAACPPHRGRRGRPPVPDAAGQRRARPASLALAQELTADDLRARA